ncbi:MAG TPA: HAD-IA family hydrolase [Xanthobacteraceae bacterium]|nr:HAD-IA family hydrolase [Xanthobacteraceae bacterium]
MVIFDCNGVLVDSEGIAASVAAEEFNRIGFPLTPEIVGRHFAGRRNADMFAAVEAATGRKLPSTFNAIVTAAILRRFRTELRAMPHVAYALTWLRGPKCVASSSSLERIRVSLETTDLLRFFGVNLFSATDVARGKPAPDLFLRTAARMGITPADCIVVEDSAPGVAAACAAGMTAIGFLGANHSDPSAGASLMAAGARTIIADMRALKSTVFALRGW